MQNKELVIITTAGSVDDGKSTLIGRLLYDCNDIYEDHIKDISKNGDGLLSGDDLALLTDGLSAEREQGITIDVAYRHFSRPNRKFIIADVPGHEQYTKNMVTGASKANMALILADARKGMLRQSKRHLFIASLLGIKHIVIVVNKMDLVDYRKDVFDKIKNDFVNYATKMNIPDLEFIPVSAYAGDMVVNRGDNMDWYNGSTLLDFLENTPITTDRNLIDFRFTVQYVIRPNQDFRGYAGIVESGVVNIGDEIKIFPGRRSSRVKELYIGEKKVDYIFEGQSALVVIEDEIDISRGDIFARLDNLPREGESIETMISWFSENSLDLSKTYLIKHGARVIRCSFSNIKYALDVENLHRIKTDKLELNDIARVEIILSQSLFFDVYKKNKNTGNFIIINELTNETVGAGVILSKGKKSNAILETKKKGAVLWFTGLSGSGKSTIADALYKKLAQRNINLERLDGDDVREHLTSDLGFSREDRDKNLDRVSYVASLLAKHGVLVLATFVSPYEEKRKEIKERVNNFVEIFVNASLDECIKRDVKGLYKRALNKEIENFTGISDPYEEPKNPDLEIRADKMNVEESVEKIVEYLEGKKII